MITLELTSAGKLIVSSIVFKAAWYIHRSMYERGISRDIYGDFISLAFHGTEEFSPWSVLPISFLPQATRVATTSLLQAPHPRELDT